MPHEHGQPDRIHAEDLVLDIGGEIGALVIYTPVELRELEIEISRAGESKRVHTQVHERVVNGRTLFAGVFPDLAAGEVAEVDWR
jgi:hypothetical protein